MIKFTVPGRPQGSELKKARGRYYVPREVRAYQGYVALMAKTATSKKTKKDVSVKIMAYFKDRKWCDIDNICRLVLNSCTGICYDDDRQAAKLVAERFLDIYERLEVEIEEC